MSVDLQCLIELETLDRAVAKLENSKMEYPLRVTEMEAVLLEQKGLLSVAESKLETIKKDISKAEQSLEENKLGLDTSHDRLNLVKTNREYDAILLEITERKEMIEKDRKKKKKFSDKIENLEADLADAQSEYDEAAAELQPQIDELKSKIDSIDDDVADVVAKRPVVAATVPAEFLEEYNRIHENRKSSRVLSIVNDNTQACSHCYQVLNAHIKKQGQTSNNPTFCENCGSLIVWEKIEKTADIEENVK